ncbi:MAG: hypothetical protein JWM40_2611, partial [Frankiales bacterium]|nr:hypothetical protein [Frankiales bacterium]
LDEAGLHLSWEVPFGIAASLRTPAGFVAGPTAVPPGPGSHLFTRSS